MYTIYSKPACTYCEQAKSLLAARGLTYTEINIDVGQPKIEGVAYLGREEFVSAFPDQKTLPLIFRDDNVRIGGFMELRQALT